MSELFLPLPLMLLSTKSVERQCFVAFCAIPTSEERKLERSPVGMMMEALGRSVLRHNLHSRIGFTLRILTRSFDRNHSLTKSSEVNQLENPIYVLQTVSR